MVETSSFLWKKNHCKMFCSHHFDLIVRMGEHESFVLFKSGYFVCWLVMKSNGCARRMERFNNKVMVAYSAGEMGMSVPGLPFQSYMRMHFDLVSP